jgi:hypothetical protein
MMRAMLGMPDVPPPGINMHEYRPHSLNQPYRFREALKSGKSLIGTAIAFVSPEGDWMSL